MADAGDPPHFTDAVLSEWAPPIASHRHEGDPVDEQENFYACKACGEQVDMRDLRQVLWHEQPGHWPLGLAAANDN
ncbi:MAG: hypothetical protein E5Y07_00535 [Mesorhizobium sp.]|nr:MAG: hypothetical protein E5Y07_00535 [Mesorhizobium sp.]